MAQNSIPLTEDGYATIEPEAVKTDKKLAEHILPQGENPGYDKLSDQDPVNEESSERTQETAAMGSDNYDYAEAYWEPSNNEEELMSQLYSTLKLQRIPAESVE